MALTPKQNEIVKATRGHFVVLAGPGCGKTHTITEKICYIFEREKIPEPYRLLALTFTDYSARIMRSYLRSKGFDRWDRVYIGTFHSFGSYLLRSFGKEIGIKENFQIIELNERKKLLEDLNKQYSIGIRQYDLGELFDRSKRGEITLEEGKYEAAKKILLAYNSYNQILREKNLLDFGDLIFLSTKLLQQSDFVKRVVTNTFRYIIVDEFQDTDKQQLELVKILAQKAIGSTIVGDDDQSIFGWRGAYRENIYKIKDALNATEKILGENFRSDEIIIEAARKIIGYDPNRRDKDIRGISDDRGNLYLCEFQNPYEEARKIGNIFISLIKEEKISNLGRSVIIARQRNRTEWIKDEFDQKKLAWFDRSTLSFQDSWETALGLATLRLAFDPFSSEFLSHLLTCVEEAGLAYRLKEDDPLTIALKIRNNLKGGVIDDFSPNNSKKILEIAGLYEMIPNASAGESNLHQRISNLNKMLIDIITLSNSQKIDLYNSIKRISGLDAVQIITGHQSKGGEFDIVFFIGLEDDILPDFRSHKDEQKIAEERRIFYVGLTRAKKSAYLTYSKTRPMEYGVKPTKRSRFIDHIPKEYFSLL